MTDTLSKLLAGSYATPDPLKETEFFKTGVKYSRFGDAGDDPDTMILKRSQLKAGIDNFSKGMGDRVYYHAYFGEDGEPIKGVPLKDDDGHVILPDLDGYKYRLVNEEWYDNKITALREQEDRIDEEMKERIFSDELNATVMGLTLSNYMAILQEGGGATVGMSAKMQELNGTVAYFRSIPPGIEQTRSMSKLRWLVSKRLANIKRNRVRASTTSKNGKEISKDGIITRSKEIDEQIKESTGQATTDQATTQVVQ